MKIFVLGGDGFCGWPTSLHLSARGHDVIIIDNLSRRKIDIELGIESLTPIRPLQDRLEVWGSISGKTIEHHNIDIAENYHRLFVLIKEYRPDVVIHFAEQRAAPYSMKSSWHKRYTVNNNINATNNLMVSLIAAGLNTHVVHLGTMGVYGYNSSGIVIPEGYLSVKIESPGNDLVEREILYPQSAGSVYHMTKTLDQLIFDYYNRNDKVRVTDLHQGIVWGTQTEQTKLDERLINRFDYDGDYGTVLNRFLVQAAVGHPLTVHGSGGQTRAFIHIHDTVRCIELALNSPPKRGSRVCIRNQATEIHQIGELADLVSELTGAQIRNLPNPRNEAQKNSLIMKQSCFLDMGLKPTTLREGLLKEMLETSRKYAHRCDLTRILCTSYWNDDRRKASEAFFQEQWND